MVERNPPREVLIKMQPIISSAALEGECLKSSIDISEAKPQVPSTAQQARLPPLTAAKTKGDIDKINTHFPRVPFGATIQTLSDTEFKKLVMATNSYEKERIFNLITTLQAQLKEHQTLMDRLEESESQRKKLTERNAAIEKELAYQKKRVQEQDERLQSLESEVIDLKLDLANEKGLLDHANLNAHQLTVRNKTLEYENQDLKNRLIERAESGEDMLIRTDFMLKSSRATKTKLSRGKGRRSRMLHHTGELASSTRTDFTAASTASGSSEVSAISDEALNRSTTRLESADNIPSSGKLLTESSEENINLESPERNLVSLTRSWVSERINRPDGNKFGYY